MNIVGKIIIILVLLKYVQNQSCSDWKEWNDFKTKFRIYFFNNKAETNAQDFFMIEFFLKNINQFIKSCQNFNNTQNFIKNHNENIEKAETLAINKFSHWVY